jgi:hypothetical protein
MLLPYKGAKPPFIYKNPPICTRKTMGGTDNEHNESLEIPCIT